MLKPKFSFLVRALGALLLACALLGGCASPPAHKDPRDPWERINRPIFDFDLALARNVAVPVGRGYNRVVPREVRTGIGNFFDNTWLPSVMVNDLLQGKLKVFLSNTGRLLMNTTVGIGGLFDPASTVGLAKNDNDFGRTLGTWGVPAGPYLVLPILGPSDVRDGIGRIPDGYMWPVTYINNTWIHYGIEFVYIFDVDSRTLVPAYDLLESQHPFDPYAFARNVYLQRRDFLIHGQSAESQEKQEEELEKSLEDDSGSAPPPNPQGSATPAPQR